MKRLTAFQVENAKPGATRREISDGSSGLYLVVQPSGHRSWAVRFRIDGQTRKLTLPAGLSLAEARVQAAAARKAAEAGADPTEAKKEAEAKRELAVATTLRAVADIYLAKITKTLRTADQIAATLRRLVYPVLGAMPIAAVKRKHVSELFDRIEAENGSVMADRTASYLSQVFKFQERRDHEFVSPMIFGMRGNSAKVRTRILSDTELRAIWNTGDQITRFLLVTAARRGEAGGLAWSELDAGDWILPAERKKRGLPLVRPLSAVALAIIEARPHEGDFVFFGGDPDKPFRSWVRHKKRIDAASGVTGWCWHDLRRTSRTIMAKAGVPHEHAEQCLGHITGSAVSRVYNRYDFHAEKKHAYEVLASAI